MSLFHFSVLNLNSGDFFWSEISWKCGSNAGASLTCQNDIITRVFSFGEDQDRNLYVLAGNVYFCRVTTNQVRLFIKWLNNRVAQLWFVMEL